MKVLLLSYKRQKRWDKRKPLTFLDCQIAFAEFWDGSTTRTCTFCRLGERVLGKRVLGSSKRIKYYTYGEARETRHAKNNERKGRRAGSRGSERKGIHLQVEGGLPHHLAREVLDHV